MSSFVERSKDPSSNPELYTSFVIKTINVYFFDCGQAAYRSWGPSLTKNLHTEAAMMLWADPHARMNIFKNSEINTISMIVFSSSYSILIVITSLFTELP